MTNKPQWIIPDWPSPPSVKALISCRQGGVSQGCYASLNLGMHVGDDIGLVQKNRSILQAHMVQMVGPNKHPDIAWIEQVHGTQVIEIDALFTELPVADASVTSQNDLACAVMTADCLPVFLCDDKGRRIAAAHAGWRGLLAGIMEKTVHAMQLPVSGLMAYLGPAIGPDVFEVGDEVRSAFVDIDPQSAIAFKAATESKWLADIYRLARLRLAAQGISRIYGGNYCTVTEKERFFSYRRDGVTGRMASVIWLNNAI